MTTVGEQLVLVAGVVADGHGWTEVLTRPARLFGDAPSTTNVGAPPAKPGIIPPSTSGAGVGGAISLRACS